MPFLLKGMAFIFDFIFDQSTSNFFEMRFSPSDILTK